MQLTIAALLIAVLISIPAGVRSAQRRGKWDDKLLSVVSLFGLSFPNFALGPILILLFSIKLGLLPVSGSGTVAHLVFAVATTAYILLAISWEERDLLRAHGDVYQRYREQVPKLIPISFGRKRATGPAVPDRQAL